MDKNLFYGLVAILAVAVLAMLMRRAGGSSDTIVPPTPRPDEDEREEERPSQREASPSDETGGEAEDGGDELLGGEEPAPHELIAVTATGDVFVPYQHDVRVLQLGEAMMHVASGVMTWDEVRQKVLGARRAEGAGLPGVQLDTGDFTAGRVVRGGADEEPWRLELLGPDGEFVPYVFETEDSAKVALAMLERFAVVLRPEGEDGEPMPVPAEQFEEARRRYEETLTELANMPEEEKG